MKKLTLEIPNISCDGCIKSIKDALMHKTKEVQIDLSSKIAQISYDEAISNEEEITRYIDLLGYQIIKK